MAKIAPLAMTDQRQTDKILDLERAALRAMCSGAAASADARSRETRKPLSEALRDAMSDLADYSWRSTEHAVVFKAIAKLQRTGDANVAEQLPAQATRMGFPDVEWNLYLNPSNAPHVEIMQLVRALKAVAANNEFSME